MNTDTITDGIITVDYGMSSRVGLYGTEWAPRSGAEWLGLSSGMAFALTNVLSRKARHVDVEVRSLSVWAGVSLVALPVMLLIEDPAGKMVRVNPAGAALLGVPVDENLSQHEPTSLRLRRSVHREGRPLDPQEFPTQRILRGEELRHEDYELAFTDGRRLSVILSGAPFYDEEGRVSGGIAGFIDVSVQRAALREVELRRREAEEASVRKTRFLAAISHDIRTPANAINLMAEVIRRAADTPALAGQIPDMVQRLRNSVTALMDLVNDLLDLSRFDSGKVELIESEFSLNDLLDGESQQFRPLAQAQGLDLIVEPLSRPIWLRTDRVKLARIVGNLIDNAIKFTPSGSVRVSTELITEPERRVLIRVADSGVGIPEDQQSRIFDEFQQLRNPERNAAKGSGLGLAISKRLADLLGCRLSVDSRPAEGTTFTLDLPPSAIALRLETLSSPKPQREEGPAPARRRLPDLRVLLIEDHDDTRAGMREFLIQEGARIDEAPDGASALERIRNGVYDVILLDLMLPDMSGTEILRALSEDRPPGLKGVLVLTGDSHQHSRVAKLGIHPDALLQKPVDLEVLVSALRAVQRYQTGTGESV